MTDTPTGYETHIEWSVEEINLQAESWNRDHTVRKLAGVDGLEFTEPLTIEQISTGNEEDGTSAEFTVWSPKGWMFGVSVPQEAQGGRPMTVTIFTEFPR